MTRTASGAIVAVLLAGSFTASTGAWRQGQSASAAIVPAAAAPEWPDAKTIEDRRRSAVNRRLFRVSEPLALTLTADFGKVNGDRDPASTRTFPATIAFSNDDGADLSMPLQLRTRGHARRRICGFAPLRLELPKDQTKGTVFDGHGALKLGTHCKNEYEEYVVREYAIYRLFNLLTPRSFRARLAKVDYVDARKGKPAGPTRYGLLIEDDDDVAKRLEGRIVELPKLTFNRVDQDTLILMTLFEYFIGNTDMSLFALHNIEVVQTPAGLRFPVPYDFDYSGLVDAQYAVPGDRLGLVTVRDRLYRGPCRTAEEFEPFFEKFRQIRTAALGVYDALPDLDPKYRLKSKEYLEEFYRTIDTPAAVKRAFIDGCKGRPYM
jgi:hypothetical protein